MDLILGRVMRGQTWAVLPLVLVFGLVLVAAIPLVAGDSEHRVEASMYVSRTEASPGDNVTFWIWIHPLKENAQKLIVTETQLEGLSIASSVAPDSCLQRDLSWVCVQDDLHPFAIEVRAVVDPATEGKDLMNLAKVEVWDNGHEHEDDTHGIAVSAEVHIVPTRVVAEPEIEVRLIANQTAVVPGDPMNYRVEVTNRGTAAASNVTVVVSIPEGMVLLSASLPAIQQDGRLTWILDSVRPGSVEIRFSATLPATSRQEPVQTGVAVTYTDRDGSQVRLETMPATVSLLPVPPAAPASALLVGFVVAVFAFIARSLFIPPSRDGLSLPASGADEIFLLHRSGLLLRHYSTNRTRATDSDIVGGMLAAVQMFVEDSMNLTAGPLQEIRFSGGSIVFVTGVNATLAAVNAKGNRIRFADRAMRFLREFETSNGDALTDFDGVAGRLNGVDELLHQFAWDGTVREAGTSQ